MNSWPAIRALFDELIDLDAPAQAARLGELPPDDPVRREVEALLIAARNAGDRFEHAAVSSITDDPTGTETPSWVGRTLGAYRLVRLIGHGGMGAVYEGERVDGLVRQRVAVKTIWRGADSALLVRRFTSERRILAGLRHPNIAQFLDAGATDDGTPFLVMEYVDGAPIDQHADQKRLDIPARLDLFLAVAAAVQHAHRSLVVHRDLKPSNVLVTADGQVKLLDFGVAKLLQADDAEGTLTGAGLSPFTLGYAAPEQVLGEPTSTATDVYALGALLTTVLAGEPPIAVTTMKPVDAMEAIREGAIRAPSQIAATHNAASALHRGFASVGRWHDALQGELDAIAGLALRTEPARRYATVDALAEDVKRYLRREQVLARPDTWRYRLTAFSRRRRPLVLGTAIAVVALLVGTLASLWQARESRKAAARSERVATFMARLTTADPTSVDPIARLGSQGTLAQLLDSLVRRVPTEFADDPRIRARLYTSIGANYRAQGRLPEAEAVLDSAVSLARATYGPRSPEFAAASIEMAASLLNRASPVESEHHLAAALAALAGQEDRYRDLVARCRLAQAAARGVGGFLRAQDSLAREVIQLELARTVGPTPIRAQALLSVAGAAAWIQRDPRIVDSLYTHAIAISDSLGTPLAFERLSAIAGRIDALLPLGRLATAKDLYREGQRAASVGYGPRSRESILFLQLGSRIAFAEQDTALAVALADSAWVVAASLSDLAADHVLLAGAARLQAAWAQGQHRLADSIAQMAVTRIERQQVPVATVFARYYAGLAAGFVGNWQAAVRHFNSGLDALPAHGDLNSMADRIRRPLANAFAQLGRNTERDSVLALITPPPASARCRPGGDWNGC